MKTVAILGGAFNPITKGHVQLANFVKENSDVDEVWITPCLNHAFNKEMLPPDIRLRLCEIATKQHEGINVCDEEIEWSKDNCNLIGTYYFLNYMTKKYLNQYSFRCIIGVDNANNFNSWIESEKLKNVAPFIAVSRQRNILGKNGKWCTKSPHMYLKANGKIDEVSSTEVRTLIKNGEYGEAFSKVNSDVFNYIMRECIHRKWK